MAGLLVSVRSVAEAGAAVAGGATVIDVKEPRTGPLGRAPSSVWRAIRAAVPPEVPVSVALGELIDLDDEAPLPGDFAGIALRKAGPAGTGSTWRSRWDRLRRVGPEGTPLVAVAYADWAEAGAPEPALILAAACATADCPGVLIDTWSKARRSPVEVSSPWIDGIAMVQASGRFVALAGGLDRAAIESLGPLGPDLFAVRGAACAGGRRDGPIDPVRVARLLDAARSGSARPDRWTRRIAVDAPSRPGR